MPEPGELTMQGSSHLRFMFPSQDPSSHRPATKNPGTDKPSPTGRLPPIGLGGPTSASSVLALLDSDPTGANVQRRRRVQSSRPARLEPVRATWPVSEPGSPQPGSPVANSALIPQPSMETTGLSLNSPSYLHYDVLVDWDKDPALDTSPFSPQMQEYTRLYYTRQPGKQKKLRPMSERPFNKASGRMDTITESSLTDTGENGGTFSLTEASVPELRGDDDVLETEVPLHLWYQYASQSLSEMDLHKLRDWASKLRPRSIQDLKPMLILCQALLKDLLFGKLATMEKEMMEATERMGREHESALASQQSKMEVMRKEMARVHAELSEARKKAKLSGIMSKVQSHVSMANLSKAVIDPKEAQAMSVELQQMRAGMVALTEENLKLETQVTELSSRLEVSKENCRTVQTKYGTLQQHVADLRAWYKESLSSLESQVEMHLLPENAPAEPQTPQGSKKPERTGSNLDDSLRSGPSALQRAKPYGKTRASEKIKLAMEEAEMIENAGITDPGVLDSMRDAESEEDVYKAAIDLLRDTAGEDANLAVIPGEDGEMLVFGTVPAPTSEGNEDGSGSKRRDHITLSGLARIEALLKGLSTSLEYDDEETRRLKEALAANRVVVGGEAVRKWMAIPLAGKGAMGGKSKGKAGPKHAQAAAILLQSRMIPRSISRKNWDSLSEAAQNAARHLERTGELPPAVLATLTEEEVAILKEQQAAVLERLNSQVQSKKLTADEEKKEKFRAKMNRQFTVRQARSDKVHGTDMDNVHIGNMSEAQRIQRYVHALTMFMFKNVMKRLGLDFTMYTNGRPEEDLDEDQLRAMGAALDKPPEGPGGKADQQGAAGASGAAGAQSGPASAGGAGAAAAEADSASAAMAAAAAAAAPSAKLTVWKEGEDEGEGEGESGDGAGKTRPSNASSDGEEGSVNVVTRAGKQDGRGVDLSRAKSVKTTKLASGMSMSTVVTEDGQTVFLVTDADGNEVPILLDEDGNAVLDAEGHVMAAVVVDAAGRQVVGADGKAIEVILDESGARVAAVELDENGAVVVGADGAPVSNKSFRETAARMEKARSERKIRATEEAGEVEEAATEGQVVKSGRQRRKASGGTAGAHTAPDGGPVMEGHGDAVLDEIRDADGKVVKPDASGLVATKSFKGGVEVMQYFMHDADGKAIPVLTDDEANPLRSKDGKPLSAYVLDVDGRVLLNSEGLPIDVILDEDGNPAALFVPGAGGLPDVASTGVYGAEDATLQIALETGYFPGPRLMAARAAPGSSYRSLLGPGGLATAKTAPPGAFMGESSTQGGKPGGAGSAGKQDGRGVDLSRAKSVKTTKLASGMSMRAVVTEDGQTVFLMTDVDGNDVPILLDEDGNAVLDAEGHVMAAVELGADGAPVSKSFRETAARMEKARSGRTLGATVEEGTDDEDSGADEELAAQEAAAFEEAERLQDAADDAEIADAGRVLMRTKSGFVVELAVDEDGEVMMVDGKAVAAVKDEDGNTLLMAADGLAIMTDFDGKPMRDADGNMIKVDQSSEGAMLGVDNSAVKRRDVREGEGEFGKPLTLEDMQQREVRVASESGVLAGQDLDVADGQSRVIRTHVTADSRRFLVDEDARPIINRQTGRPVQVREDGSVMLPGLDAAAKAQMSEVAATLQAADTDSIQAAQKEAIERKKSVKALKAQGKSRRMAAREESKKQMAEKKKSRKQGKKAKLAPEVEALLLVDEEGRQFIEDANGNHVRVAINDKGETVMADEHGNPLVDDNGDPIVVPFAEDGKADIALLPKSQRDLVQAKGHTLNDAEPLPEDVRADLDAFELEKVVQLKTISTFVSWCASRVGNKRGADNEFLDELEDVISTFRTAHVAQPWRNRAQLARITSVRAAERIDHLRTIRTTILKELDKNRTLQQLQELKNYRDPPKAAATCINAVLLILGDPNVAEFVEPALRSVPMSNNPNALKSLWKMMKPVIVDVGFTGRLNACDTTGDDDATEERCTASNFTLMQVTPQEAKRVSKVVALMRHWVELQLLIHEQALEYRRTHHVPAGKQIDLGGPAKKSLVDSMPPPV